MTYKNCKKLIDAAEKRNTKTEDFILDMKTKLSVFLQNKRISKKEHDELESMLNN